MNRTDVFEPLSDSQARIKLKKIVGPDWINWVEQAKRQSTANALRFGLGDVTRAYNYYNYQKRFEGLVAISPGSLEELCAARGSDIVSIKNFIGIYNDINLYKCLTFWDKAPVTYEQTFKPFGIDPEEFLLEVKMHGDKIRAMPLKTALRKLKTYPVAFSECGYVSPTMLAIECLSWRQSA